MIIPAEKSVGQNSAYRHRNYEGRFRKRMRPSHFCQRKTFSPSYKDFAERGLAPIFRSDYGSESWITHLYMHLKLEGQDRDMMLKELEESEFTQGHAAK